MEFIKHDRAHTLQLRILLKHPDQDPIGDDLHRKRRQYEENIA